MSNTVEQLDLGQLDRLQSQVQLARAAMFASLDTLPSSDTFTLQAEHLRMAFLNSLHELIVENRIGNS